MEKQLCDLVTLLTALASMHDNCIQRYGPDMPDEALAENELMHSLELYIRDRLADISDSPGEEQNAAG